MRPPSCAFFQDLWRPQTRDQEEYIHLESVLHSGSQNASQLASNQWHIWTPHTVPISEEGWQSVMSLDAHEDEQRCRENHLLGNCELVRIRLRGRRTLKPPTQCGALDTPVTSLAPSLYLHGESKKLCHLEYEDTHSHVTQTIHSPLSQSQSFLFEGNTRRVS